MASGISTALQQALDLGEVGIAVAIYANGELVTQEWAGVADSATGAPVVPATLFPAFSVTKAIAATALHVQAERGLISYDAAVADYWPEFGAHGKSAITVSHLLAHRAGVPQMPAEVTIERMCDWDWMTARLAELTPLYPTDTVNAYHALGWGWIIGELVTRTDPGSRSLPQFLREEVGVDDIYLGISDAEAPRVARLEAEPSDPPPPGSVFAQGMPAQIFPSPLVHNRADVQRACLPSAGGIMTAAAAAEFFGLLANPGRLLSRDRVESFLVDRRDGSANDLFYGRPRAIGRGAYHLGDMRTAPLVADRPTVLCHMGAGGATAWADTATGVSAAIMHNRMYAFSIGPDPKDPLQIVANALWAEVDQLTNSRHSRH